MPFSSESTLFALLCDTGVDCKHFSLSIWQMLRFVSRGHWKATAGGRALLLISLCFFPSCVLWLLVALGTPSGSHPPESFTSTHWMASQWVLKAPRKTVSCSPALACLTPENFTTCGWQLWTFQWGLSLSLGFRGKGLFQVIFLLGHYVLAKGNSCSQYLLFQYLLELSLLLSN